MRRSFHKISLYCALIMLPFITYVNANAQQPINRANSTIIVDALNQLPAEDEESFNRLISDIVSTGQEGLDMLIFTLEKKDDAMVKAEYALDGLTMYASADSFNPAFKNQLVDNFQKALRRVNNSSQPDGDLVGFYEKQLKRLGAITAQTPALPSQNAPTDPASVKKAVAAAVQVIKNGNREERFATFYSIANPADYYASFKNVLPKLSNDARIDLIWWFGEQKDIANEDVVAASLKSSDKRVVDAACWALVKMHSEKVIPFLCDILKSSDDEEIVSAEACLKCSFGPVADAVAGVFDDASESGKVAVLHILAQRGSETHKNLVLSSLESSVASVKSAAYSSLKDVVTLDDIDELYSILENTDINSSAPVCDAILKAMYGKNNMELHDIFTGKYVTASPDVREKYMPLIIRTANIDQLFCICERTIKEKGAGFTIDMAFNAFVKTIEESTDIPGAQKLLLLRKAMGIAQTDAHKCAVLAAIGETGEFLGIIYAGTMIENPALQQAAARAIMRLSLNHPENYGPEVSNLLSRVAEVLEGKDSEYEKTAVLKCIAEMPEGGFVSMFDGTSLAGWKGLVENPYVRAGMTDKKMAKAQKEADVRMAENWKVEDGCIVYEGKGFDNLCTEKQYGDFEMYVDWMLDPTGAEPDAGIYLRGTPQVQIWDTSRVDVGAQVGSGGLYNNQKNPSQPDCVADNALGQWNSFYIKMVGERVTVLLNGIKVVDNVILENYWDRSLPIPMMEQIELQAHGSRVFFRNIYIRELPQTEPCVLSEEEKNDGFELLFDGTSLHRFKGNLIDYSTDNGTIHVCPTGQGYGNLYVDDEFSDFIFRFDFKLTPGANNGVGIRCEEGKDAAYYGMEIQILDHFNPIYQPGLRDYQYHGSVYGIIPAKVRDAHNPVGEWNSEEIYAKGNHIRVTLNGIVINEGDIDKAAANGTYDGNEHPGLFNQSGLIGFLGHGSELWIKNVRVKKL